MGLKFCDVVSMGDKLGIVCFACEKYIDVLILNDGSRYDVQVPEDTLKRLGSEKQPVDLEKIKKKYKKFFH